MLYCITILFCYSIAVPELANKLRYQNTSKEKRQIHKHYENEFKRKIVQLHIGEVEITQSMSSAGCPYDNAPIERYFNTLKNELIYHYVYKDEEQLYKAVEEESLCLLQP